MDVKNLFLDTLQTLGYPIRLQGSMLAKEKYPDHFFTYFNNDSMDDAFYNNQETETIWDFDLNFYSIDPTLVNTMLLEAKKLLRQNGFIVDGKGYDVLSDEPTHTGRGINILFIEREE